MGWDSAAIRMVRGSLLAFELSELRPMGLDFASVCVGCRNCPYNSYAFMLVCVLITLAPMLLISNTWGLPGSGFIVVQWRIFGLLL